MVSRLVRELKSDEFTNEELAKPVSPVVMKALIRTLYKAKKRL